MAGVTRRIDQAALDRQGLKVRWQGGMRDNMVPAAGYGVAVELSDVLGRGEVRRQGRWIRTKDDLPEAVDELAAWVNERLDEWPG